MRAKGFANQALMGAILLAGAWFAIYLPHLAPTARLGAWPTWLIIAVYGVGVAGGPALLVAIEGDELLGGLGIVAALLAGWASARIATLMGAAPGIAESIRLCGAALGPIFLYSGFHLAFQRRKG